MRLSLPSADFWTLNKLIVLLLLGAIAMLLTEIRYDHRFVLRETRVSWTPLLYSATLLALGLPSLALWERGGRQLLFWLFAAALLVGAAGFWFHNGGRPLAGVGRILAVWLGRPGSYGGSALESPPVLAPLSFCGLGALGLLACARRFQPATTNINSPGDKP